MKRTWKDAAVDVAWNQSQINLEWYPIEAFLNNGRHITDSGFIHLLKDKKRINFNDFRAAFMRWLDENERKK